MLPNSPLSFKQIDIATSGCDVIMKMLRNDESELRPQVSGNYNKP